MLDHVVLQTDQEDVLAKLVEASRNVPTDERQPFHGMAFVGGRQHTLNLPGLPGDQTQVCLGDLQALSSEGLLTLCGGDVWGRAGGL